MRQCLQIPLVLCSGLLRQFMGYSLVTFNAGFLPGEEEPLMRISSSGALERYVHAVCRMTVAALQIHNVPG